MDAKIKKIALSTIAALAIVGWGAYSSYGSVAATPEAMREAAKADACVAKVLEKAKPHGPDRVDFDLRDAWTNRDLRVIAADCAEQQTALAQLQAVAK